MPPRPLHPILSQHWERLQRLSLQNTAKLHGLKTWLFCSSGSGYDPVIAKLSKKKAIEEQNGDFDEIKEEYIELKKIEWAAKQKAWREEEEKKAQKYIESNSPTEKSHDSANFNEAIDSARNNTGGAKPNTSEF